MKLKNGLFICVLQLICGSAFSQEPSTNPKPKETVGNQEPVIYDLADEPTDFPGGRSAMMKFMAENLRYPQVAVELGIQGKCYLEFLVTETGELTNIRVKKGVTDCPDCDKEAIRMVKLMPNWIPAKNSGSGKSVKSYYVLPVTFKLN